MSLEDVVGTIARVAVQYPYFTWDEADSFRSDHYAAHVREKRIKECHCRIFADDVLKLVVASDDIPTLPLNMDKTFSSRIAQVKTAKHGDTGVSVEKANKLETT